MQYASNQGVRIHYEVEGEGPPLVLQHGMAGSLDSWYDNGFVAPLKKNHRLVLIDARGHGASDKPHEPEAYELKLMVGDVITVLDDLNVSQAHYLGYSMGSWIGFGVAKYASERFYSLILGGWSPYRTEAEVRSRAPIRQGLAMGLDAHFALSEKEYGPRPPEEKTRFLANDAQALMAVAKAMLDQPSLEDLLPLMTMPCLVYAGEADLTFYAGAKECVQQIPNALFVSFRGFNHLEAQRRSDLVLPHITRFLAEVSRT